MKVVVVKKGVKRWLNEQNSADTGGCCQWVEGMYWNCSKVAAA